MNDFQPVTVALNGKQERPYAAEWGVQKLYRYKARVHPGMVHDGDTFDVLLDLGFGLDFRFTVRPWGYDAPELDTPEGFAALTYLMDLFEEMGGDWNDEMARLAIETVKEKDGDDKTTFGRYLCHVAFEDAQGRLVDLAQHMIDAGHGVRRTR